MFYEAEGRDKFIWVQQIFINTMNKTDTKFSSRLGRHLKRKEHNPDLIKSQVSLEVHITVFAKLIYFRLLVKM